MKSKLKVGLIIGGIVLALGVIGAGAVFLLTRGVSEENLKKSAGLVTEGYELIESRGFSEALAKFDEARILNRTNPDIYVGIAKVYLMKNRQADARKILEEGQKMVYDDRRVTKAFGELELFAGNYEKAETLLKKASNQKKDDYWAKYQLAVTYVNTSQFEKALALLNFPVKAGDDYIRSQLLKAVLLKDNLAAAQTELASAKEVTTSSKELSDMVASYDAALVRISKIPSAEQSPKYTAAILAGEALALGFEDVTVSLLDQYKDDPYYWEVQLYLGWANLINKNYVEATKYLSETGRMNPGDYLSPLLMCRTYLIQEDLSAMTTSCVRAVQLAPDKARPEVALEYVEILKSLERYQEADEQVSALIKLDKENSATYNLIRAEIALLRKVASEAKTYLGTVNRDDLAPEKIPRYSWLMAWVSLEDGSTQQAQTWIEEAISKDPLEAKYQFMLGRIHFEAGNREKAKTALNKAVDLDLAGDVSAQALRLLERI